MGQISEETQFENDVRRLARALYPQSQGGDPEHMLGRERDSIFVTHDTVIVIEATVSRRADKIKDDGQKTKDAIVELRKIYTDKLVRGFIITRDTPTADQVEAIKRYAPYSIRLESFSSFRGRIYDVAGYVGLRKNYAFGSLYNLETGSHRIDKGDFVSLHLLEKASEDVVTIPSLAKDITAGRPIRAVFLGDYGSGKSTTLFQYGKTLQVKPWRGVMHGCQYSSICAITLVKRIQ